MVKYFAALLIVMALAAPAFAQDVPQVELGFGYGNINVEDSGRHSGFATHQTFNLSNWFAIENYLGYYGFGSDSSYGKANLITNVFGGKLSYRSAPGPVLYASAGFGGGFISFPQSGVGSSNAMAYKMGGGIDIPFKENFAWKVDVSRMAFHFNGWNSGTNISTGIVLKIGGF